MAQKFRTAVQQKVQVKTVTLLLGFYFSALIVMIVFTGFFVYSNFSVPYKSVAASPNVQSDRKTNSQSVKPASINEETNIKTSE